MEQPALGQPTQRIVSVDALRGYAMFWTVAGVPIVSGLNQLHPSPVVDFLRRQFTHSSWHGLTYYDFGFPFYLMLIGTAITLSLTKHIRQGASNRDLYKTVIRRTLVLFFLGIIYGGGFANPWPDIRIAGILQRLAICYFCGVVIFLHMNTLSRSILLAVILLGYWAMLALIPVPGYGAGDYSFEGNLVAYVDSQFLPGRAYHGQWDPEGILSTLPSIGSCLAGILLGEWLLKSQLKPQGKALALLILGIFLINTGLIWDGWFPINKRMWTSSYVVVTAGWCCVHLFLFFQVAEVWGRKNWVYPFVVFGRNAIAVFVGVQLIDFESIARRFVGGSIGASFGAAEQLVVALTTIGIVWLILYWLNRQKIDIKV